MISLSTGALPKRKARGVFQVIAYFRELAGLDDHDNFGSFPDEIIIPAVRIFIPDMSFTQEIYGSGFDPNNQIHLKILDRNEREPKIMLFFGDPSAPSLISGESRMSIIGNPFRDIKQIEEYDAVLPDDPNVRYTLIKVCLEKMNITFAKWL
jgi:hypothetical protein